MTGVTKELVRGLPTWSEAQAGSDMDRRTRGVLSLLFDAEILSMPSVAQDPSLCPNCDAPAASLKSPYCGECCKEESSLVRQVRGGLLSGAILEPERQIGLGQKLWHVLGGGRPHRLWLLPKRGWERVIEKAEGKCQLCGAEATTIEHIGTG